jgi:uncharacterized membrane protein YphA (DoxX/SURF4 family)
MKIALWIVSALLAFVFIASGSMKLFNFDQYAQMAPRSLIRVGSSPSSAFASWPVPSA